MRILMASHAYPPTVSGVTLVVQKVARAMVARGHAVTIICGSDGDQPYRDEDEGVRLVRVRGLSNPWWKETTIPFINRKELDEIVDEVRPEILHAHEAFLLALRLLRVKRDLGLPTLATAYYVPRFAARYVTWDTEPKNSVESIVWAYTTWVFNQFDHIAFATKAHRDAFLSEGLKAPTTIISNGIDTERYSPVANGDGDVQARYGLPPGPRILFVSRLMRDKEIDILIEAMPRVYAGRQAHLLLAGRGDDRPRLEKLVDDLGLRHCVHFLGFVTEEDMPALYRVVDVFAIASLYEVQSLPTLQALATALPVVAANAVALPEIVHDGVNGFLVPPADPEAMAGAILRILGDGDLAARMGQAGLKLVQPHAESHTFDQYEALYRQALSGPAGLSP